MTRYPTVDLGNTLTASVRIPFTLIPSAKADTVITNHNVNQTPFYTLSRIERIPSLTALDYRQNHTDIVLEYKAVDTFLETETSKLTKSVGLSITGGGSPSFLGSGGSWEATLDTSLSWSNSTSSSFGYSVSNSAVYKAPAGKFVELVQLVTEFLAYDATGGTVENPTAAG